MSKKVRTAVKEEEQFQTAVIWDGGEEIKYIIINEDLRKFQGVYCNSSNDDIDNYEELTDELMHKTENWNEIGFVSIEEFRKAIVNGAFLIECGFML